MVKSPAAFSAFGAFYFFVGLKIKLSSAHVGQIMEKVLGKKKEVIIRLLKSSKTLRHLINFSK